MVVALRALLLCITQKIWLNTENIKNIEILDVVRLDIILSNKPSNKGADQTV